MRPSNVRPGQQYFHKTAQGVVVEVQLLWLKSPEKWQCIFRQHTDPALVGCNAIFSGDNLRANWQEVEGPPPPTDLERVCQVAQEWVGEYGFAAPEEAKQVLDAVHRLREAHQSDGRVS